MFWSKAHSDASEIRQILAGRAPVEIDLEVHCGEVGRRTTLQKGLLLLREIRSVLRAVGRRAYVQHAGVLAARVLVPDCAADIGVQNTVSPGMTWGIDTSPAMRS
jgi:hypothetical protein